MVLRYGEVVPLIAKNKDNNWENQVLAFARFSIVETAIIATNLNDADINCWVDMSPLKELYSKT
jgi:hypothetical protein